MRRSVQRLKLAIPKRDIAALDFELALHRTRKFFNNS